MDDDTKKRISEFINKKNLEKIVVYGENRKTGKRIREILGDKFLVYLNSGTIDPQIAFDVKAIIISTSPIHYSAIIQTLKNIFRNKKITCVTIFGENPTRPVPDKRTVAPLYINQAPPFMDNIFYSSKHEITFISSPKVACTTIKNSLLEGKFNESGGEVHQKANELFSLPDCFNKPVFVITRNPYSRILSAYKDKTGKGKDPNVWLPFAQKYKFLPESQPSFYEVLMALSNDKSPEDMDMHFRPQIFNIYHDDITPAFVGRIERMDEVTTFLSSHMVTLRSKTEHATNSLSEYKNEISKDEEKLINQIYQKDFDAFGYEMDLQSDFIPPSVHQKQKINNRIYQFASILKWGLTADDLFELALKKERSRNINAALDLMSVAQSLSPGDLTIKQKLQDYKKLM